MLRRPARPRVLRPLDGHLEVAAAGELVEVVAGDVGVELELLGHLGRGDAPLGVVGEEVDLPPGGVAEGAGDRADRGTELIRRQSRLSHPGILPIAIGEIGVPPRCRQSHAERSRSPRSPAAGPGPRAATAASSTSGMVKGIRIDGGTGRRHRRPHRRRLPAAGRDHRAGHRRGPRPRRRRPRRRRAHGHDRRRAGHPQGDRCSRPRAARARATRATPTPPRPSPSPTPTPGPGSSACRRARAAWASRPSPSTWPSPSAAWATRWPSSTPTSTASPSPGCSASPRSRW